jgi:hypothetical protein
MLQFSWVALELVDPSEKIDEQILKKLNLVGSSDLKINLKIIYQ